MSRVSHMSTKEHVATHTNLTLHHNSCFMPSSYCNTIGQSSFISFAIPWHLHFLKLKHSVLLVMYNWYKETRTCLIGYSGFISCNWFLFLIAWGVVSHGQTFSAHAKRSGGTVSIELCSMPKISWQIDWDESDRLILL